MRYGQCKQRNQIFVLKLFHFKQSIGATLQCGIIGGLENLEKSNPYSISFLKVVILKHSVLFMKFEQFICIPILADPTLLTHLSLSPAVKYKRVLLVCHVCMQLLLWILLYGKSKESFKVLYSGIILLNLSSKPSTNLSRDTFRTYAHFRWSLICNIG